MGGAGVSFSVCDASEPLSHRTHAGSGSEASPRRIRKSAATPALAAAHHGAHPRQGPTHPPNHPPTHPPTHPTNQPTNQPALAPPFQRRGVELPPRRPHLPGPRVRDLPLADPQHRDARGAPPLPPGGPPPAWGPHGLRMAPHGRRVASAWRRGLCVALHGPPYGLCMGLLGDAWAPRGAAWALQASQATHATRQQRPALNPESNHSQPPPQIPHYHLREATAAVKPVLG
jgi:hypothetical protein